MVVQIESVIIRRLRMKMKEPFVTSFGSEEDKDVIILELRTKAGAVGFAECTASEEPLYSEETNETAWHLLRDFLIPRIFTLNFASVDDLHNVRSVLSPYRGNKMAKAAIEMGVWDAFANETQTPLHILLGGQKSEIPVGISVGIQPTIPQLVEKVEGYLEQGFQRIKVKIKPGVDYEPLSALRKAFGDIPMMADANSVYRLSDADQLRSLDELQLMMIEQPLGNDDLVDHAQLQKHLNTPICLDESIHSTDDARKAISIDAGRIINLKVGRVGGFSEALAIHDVCTAARVPLWCGGMLETGIGRLHNIAITSLSGFSLPGDTAPSARYFEEDIIDPAVSFSRPGYLAVEPLCGTADRVRRERLEKWTVQTLEIRASQLAKQ